MLSSYRRDLYHTLRSLMYDGIGLGWLLCGLGLLVCLLTYSPYDPSSDVLTSAVPQNSMGIWGAFVANHLFQWLGVSAFVLPSFCLACFGCMVWRYSLKFVGWTCGFLVLVIALHQPMWTSYPNALACILYTRIPAFWIRLSLDLGILWWMILVLGSKILQKISSLLFLERASRIFSMVLQKVFPPMNQPTDQGMNIKMNQRIHSATATRTKDQLHYRSSSSTRSHSLETAFGGMKVPEQSKFLPAKTFRKEIFSLPDLTLLQDHVTQKNDRKLELHLDQLQSVLEDFGIKGSVMRANPGPIVTLYELEPAAGVKSYRIISLADDIARSMSALSARVAVISGKNLIGIELSNVHREMVYLKDLLASCEYLDFSGTLPLALGKDIGGTPVIVDLTKMPHLLVAGTTGSGKSVGINSMILSLLYRLSPAQCKMIMIDPKMLELSVYNGIPHLLSPVITEPKKAIMALKWLVQEMENRYRLMSQIGVRHILGYNQRVTAALAQGQPLVREVQVGFDESRRPVVESQSLNLAPLPFVVVIVDEMADLMLVAGKELEILVQRLAQMARASGIHLIMATQRPSVDVITGTIKANFPTRISFQVTSKIDSRTILGEQGAEHLLGQGDMLYMASGGRITRVHGPFVSDEEIENVVGYLKKLGEPQYVDITIKEDEGGSAGEGEEGENDLYRQALEIIHRERKVSISYLQRQLQIGYNRAARLVEQMEKEGVVSAPSAMGKREILS